MSQLDSGMDILASPLSPLKQSLIRAMPNSFNPPMQAPASAGGAPGPFTAAHNYGRSRAAGSPYRSGGGQLSGGQGMPMGGGPLNTTLYKTALLDAIDADDDTRKKLMDLPVDQLRDVLDRRHQAATTRQAKKPLVTAADFGEQQEAQPTIGGPTPEGVERGSIEISQGSGRDGRAVMSQEGIMQRAARAQQNMPAGEHVSINPASAGGRAGFTVSGITPPSQAPAPPQNPAVAVLNQLQQSGIPQDRINLYKQHLIGGGTLEEVISDARQWQHGQQTLTHQKAADDRTAARETKSDQHAEFSENARRLDETRHRIDELLRSDSMLRGGVQSGHVDIAQQSPNYREYQILQGAVQGLRRQVMGGGTNQSTAAPSAQGSPAQGAPAQFTWQGRQFQAGQTIKGPDGRSYRLTGKMHPEDGSPEAVLAE